MITYKEVDRSYFTLYDSVSQNVEVRSEFRADYIDGGLGGVRFTEVPVEPYVKDLSVYERAVDYEKQFDISNWRFYMAFDGDRPVGAATVAGKTENLYMLYGKKDACVLWDIRVQDDCKHQGIGRRLMDMAVSGAKEDGYRMMVIESQNNNVTACRFYRKMGAVLSKIDADAYGDEPGLENEIQFLWKLDISGNN